VGVELDTTMRDRYQPTSDFARVGDLQVPGPPGSSLIKTIRVFSADTLVFNDLVEALRSLLLDICVDGALSTNSVKDGYAPTDLLSGPSRVRNVS